MLSLLTWDNAAVALAVVAVLLRLADRPRAATIASGVAVLAANIGQLMRHYAPTAGSEK